MISTTIENTCVLWTHCRVEPSQSESLPVICVLKAFQESLKHSRAKKSTFNEELFYLINKMKTIQCYFTLHYLTSVCEYCLTLWNSRVYLSWSLLYCNYFCLQFVYYCLYIIYTLKKSPQSILITDFFVSGEIIAMHNKILQCRIFPISCSPVLKYFQKENSLIVMISSRLFPWIN